MQYGEAFTVNEGISTLYSRISEFNKQKEEDEREKERNNRLFD